MGLIVEQGIAHDQRHGSVAAWRFLSSNGVPEELILRVLSDPARRRASDTPAPHTLRHDGLPVPQPLSDTRTPAV